jgi:Na+/H+ antiporter NhaA
MARAIRFTIERFLLMPIGAVIALIWANTAAESYFQFAYRLSFFVNEIAMALFFALLAQEVYEATMPGGALHAWREPFPCICCSSSRSTSRACRLLGRSPARLTRC